MTENRPWRFGLVLGLWALGCAAGEDVEGGGPGAGQWSPGGTSDHGPTTDGTSATSFGAGGETATTATDGGAVDTTTDGGGTDATTDGGVTTGGSAGASSSTSSSADTTSSSSWTAGTSSESADPGTSGALQLTITVDSAEPAVLTAHQVALDLTPASFDYAAAAPGGADLRVSTNGVDHDVPYWIETWNAGGTSRIWIRVPSIPALASTQLYLLYGDPAAQSASDGEATFEVFDDFGGTTLDTGAWDVHGVPSTLQVAGGELLLAGDSNWEYIGSTSAFGDGVVVHTSHYAEGGGSAGLVVGDAASFARYVFWEGTDDTLRTGFDADVNGGIMGFDATYPGVPYATGSHQEHEVAIRRTGSTGLEVLSFCNVTQASCNTTPRPLNYAPISTFVVGFTTFSPSYELHVDRIFVRKYAQNQPTASVG